MTHQSRTLSGVLVRCQNLGRRLVEAVHGLFAGYRDRRTRSLAVDAARAGGSSGPGSVEGDSSYICWTLLGLAQPRRAARGVLWRRLDAVTRESPGERAASAAAAARACALRAGRAAR